MSRRRTAPRRAGRFLRGASGLLAGGLVALAVGLGIAWFVANRYGSVGPGPVTLAWHGVGAVAGVLAQVQADRRYDVLGTLAAWAVVVITALVVTIEWLA